MIKLKVWLAAAVVEASDRRNPETKSQKRPRTAAAGIQTKTEQTSKRRQNKNSQANQSSRAQPKPSQDKIKPSAHHPPRNVGF
ncbi:hypothetical protein LWI29_003760 [Acer saccharum]|uniref:Uncharacterized protein n=1 Tax=Acer saccharum TaxID=4024 RepID=A0AA39VT06_ACESA|nr:hypothetical protein LWI29_003760 [Acer saccharum]KAK1579054.1 hypothetical protein Q3G72_035191 [Acer saccharum]